MKHKRRKSHHTSSLTSVAQELEGTPVSQHAVGTLHPAAPHRRVFPQRVSQGPRFSKSAEHHFPLLPSKTENTFGVPFQSRLTPSAARKILVYLKHRAARMPDLFLLFKRLLQGTWFESNQGDCIDSLPFKSPPPQNCCLR